MSDARHRPFRRHRGAGHTRRLLRDSSGNVIVFGALGMLILASLVGGGVDMARAYKAERRLQSACDAGVLAGRRAVDTDGFDTAAVTQARQFFNANYSEAAEQTTGTVFTPTSDDEGNTVNGSATATLPTVIMRVFGFENLPLSVSCTASMGVGNSDIVMVLDNTGSMDWDAEGNTTFDPTEKRIYALKQSMMDFFDTVNASVAGTNARIRYAFVPYGTQVNVGHLLAEENSSYIADFTTIQSRQAVTWSDIVATWTDVSETPEEIDNYSRTSTGPYSSKSTCETHKPANTAWAKDGDEDPAGSSNVFDPSRGTDGQKVSATGVHQDYHKYEYECRQYDLNGRNNDGYYVAVREITKTVTSYTYKARNPIPVTTVGQPLTEWIYRPVTFSTATYKTFVAVSAPIDEQTSGGIKKTKNTPPSKWAGCIMERKTTPAPGFSFASLATGIVASNGADALDLDIDAAPDPSDPDTQWKPLWPEVSKLRASVTPAFNGSNATTYCPYGSQLLSTMDEEDFNGYVSNLAAQSIGTYHDFGLLWGARIASPTGIFADNVNEAPRNGGTVSRHLIFMTDGDMDTELTANSLYGIERLDRRITGNGDAGDQEDNHRARFLAICEAVKARGIRLWVIAFGTNLTSDLSTCGSPNSSFQADDSEELDENFQEIAKQVGELRVVQ